MMRIWIFIGFSVSLNLDHPFSIILSGGGAPALHRSRWSPGALGPNTHTEIVCVGIIADKNSTS